MSSSSKPSSKRSKKPVSNLPGASNQAAIPPEPPTPPQDSVSHQVAIPPKPPISPKDSGDTPVEPPAPDLTVGEESVSTLTEEINLRQHPIPPPSEPMQYRAIGLVRGRYTSSDEQFTQGTLLTSDGTAIDAVLLGRIMSLVKNHLNLEEEHLWVVYPRTRQQDSNLHTQIVGVWEPETLSSANPSTEALTEEELAQSAQTETKASVSKSVSSTEVEDGYFSIRGEVIYQGQDPDHIIVKIKQAPRKLADGPKFFKLKLVGTLTGKAVGHFWEFHVRRQDNSLTIQASKDIGLLPPTKKPKGASKSFRPGGKKPWTSNRPPRKDYKPTTETSSISSKEPLPKPIKKVDRPVKRPTNPE